jgi:predicted GIY-YIG superfamily endonuclease
MPFWLYILRCSDGSYYTGHTDDLERRIAEHQEGVLACYTQLRRPVQLVFSQEMATREEALAAELQIKNWTRRKKEALIRGDFEALRAAAKKRFRRPYPPC